MLAAKQGFWCAAFYGNFSARNRLVILHARSIVPRVNLLYKLGSTSGDYNGWMNYENFKKWAEHKLLPNISQELVIVMENEQIVLFQLNIFQQNILQKTPYNTISEK